MTQLAAPGTSSHLPPQSLESEEAVIGAMLLDPRVIEIAAEMGLQRRDFYRPSHQLVFDAIMELDATGQVDELTVARELERRGHLAEVGGTVAVTTFADRVPSVANARTYIEDVIHTAVHRRTAIAGHAISELGYERKLPPLRLVAEAGRLVDDVLDSDERADGEWTTLDAEFEHLTDALARRREAGTTMVGLSTGLEVLDQRWGGVQNSRLYIGAGRPGMGKSAWLYGVLEHIAIEQGQHVAVFNFEMNPEQQAARAAARQGGADLHRITNALPTDADIEQVAATRTRLYEASPRLHINRRASMTIQQLQQSARRLNRKLVREHGTGLAAVGVDYMQLLDGEHQRGPQNRTQDLSHISRGLKLLAKELDVPVIALSQLNRSVEARTPPRPILSDLRESGAIEQDADVVLLLFRPEYYDNDVPPEWQGKAEAITAKWRDGIPGTDILGWDGPRTRFLHARDAPSRVFVAGGPREGVVV